MKKQQGFTIIELVVVILLLGILTATALPRFMDVSTEAHGAVVDGVESGLRTGLALYRATWMAENQPQTNVGFGDNNMVPHGTSGYPIGTDGTASDEADCLAVYNGLLQVGRPAVGSAAFSATAATLEGNVEGAAASVDFVAVGLDAATPMSGCVYYYVGQYKSGSSTTTRPIPTLTYTFSTGEIAPGSVTFNQD